MATKKTIAETVPAVSTETKFPIEKLRANCLKLFGVTSSTFDGATYGLKGEYTVEEIKNTIEKWGKKKTTKEAK